MPTLPDKPSELIRLALDDLAKVERSPRYEVDMDRWHVPNSKCQVCLAGAVMAKQLGAEPDQDMAPEFYDRDTSAKLNALDDLRTGYIDYAFNYLNIKLPDSVPPAIVVPCYREDRPGFKRALRKLAKDLEKEGL